MTSCRRPDMEYSPPRLRNFERLWPNFRWSEDRIPSSLESDRTWIGDGHFTCWETKTWHSSFISCKSHWFRDWLFIQKIWISQPRCRALVCYRLKTQCQEFFLEKYTTVTQRIYSTFIFIAKIFFMKKFSLKYGMNHFCSEILWAVGNA